MASTEKFEELIGLRECMVPGKTACDPRDLQAHLARYEWAKQFCKDKIVLDAACGSGYGTKMLAEVAEHVHGIDRSAAAVQYAWQHYAVPNNGFEERSVYAIVRIPTRFDVVASFETIEHLRKPERFVKQVYDALNEGGLFLVSAPEGSYSEWHVWDFTEETLCEVLSVSFDMSRAKYLRQNLGDSFVPNGTLEKAEGLPITHVYVCVK